MLSLIHISSIVNDVTGFTDPKMVEFVKTSTCGMHHDDAASARLNELDPDAAIEYGLAMLDAGADIIDVGGESTRPGVTPVSYTHLDVYKRQLLDGARVIRRLDRRKADSGPQGVDPSGLTLAIALDLSLIHI